MAADPIRLTGPEVLLRAARAIGKIDLWGPRGCSLCSLDEIEAMAALLASFGIPPIRPGEDDPEDLKAFFFPDRQESSE